MEPIATSRHAKIANEKIFICDKHHFVILSHVVIRYVRNKPLYSANITEINQRIIFRLQIEEQIGVCILSKWSTQINAA